MTVINDQLTELLARAAEQRALRAMEKTGVINPIITYAQVKREVGVRDARKARISPVINWHARGCNFYLQLVEKLCLTH